MKKILFVFSLCCLCIYSFGCSSLKHLSGFAHIGNKPAIQALPPYNGPKARITVADFRPLTTKVSADTAVSLRDLLVEALVSSNRFEIIKLQNIAVTSPANEALPVKAEKADLLIQVAITGFEPQSSGGRAGIGGGGGVNSGKFGGLLGSSLNKAHLSLEIKIINNINMQELAPLLRIKGQASDINNNFSEEWDLHKTLSLYRHTPMEKAIRTCIIEAVRSISQNIPPDYYKY